MSLRICRYCHMPALVAGPRNARIFGVCAAAACRLQGLLALAQADMLTDVEWTELERSFI